MPEGRNLREVGSRIEVLLEDLRLVTDVAAREKAEELVRLLVELYGAGLERVMEIVAEDEPSGQALLIRFADDALVASLLVLHGLHPLDVETRIQQALDKVRPYLGSHAGGVEFLGVDDEGVVHLRLEGSCHGCPSSTVTVKMAIERAIEEAAPEMTRIEVEGVTERPNGAQVISLDALRQSSPLPNGKDGANGSGDGQWTALEGLDRLQSGEVTPTEVDGVRIVVCRAGESLYAYRNVCPACGTGWRDGMLDGNALTCSSCGQRYDAQLAGRGLERRELYLDPLPLLVDDGQIRIAVPGSLA